MGTLAFVLHYEITYTYVTYGNKAMFHYKPSFYYVFTDMVVAGDCVKYLTMLYLIMFVIFIECLRVIPP